MYFSKNVRTYLSGLGNELDPSWRTVQSQKIIDMHSHVSYFSMTYSKKKIGIFTIEETIIKPTQVTNVGSFGEPGIYSDYTEEYYSYPYIVESMDTDGICIMKVPQFSLMPGFQFLPITSYGQNVEGRLELAEFLDLFKTECGLYFNLPKDDWESQFTALHSIWRRLQEKMQSNIAYPKDFEDVSDAFASLMKGEIYL